MILISDYSDSLVQAFVTWERSNCSKEAYDTVIIDTVMNANDTSIQIQFAQLWTLLQEMSNLVRFDDEHITLSGATLRRLMHQSARFGIENYQKLEHDCIKVTLTVWDKCNVN